jgi:predicted nucleic acid-binding protein
MPDSPHIIALTHTTPAQRTSYMNELRDISILTTGKRELTRQSRDKKDNKFLICASEAQADYLITSDKDLLDLKVYKETRIYSSTRIYSVSRNRQANC